MLKVGDKVRVVNPKLPENLGIVGIVVGLPGFDARVQITNAARSSLRVGEIVRFDAHRVRSFSTGFASWYKEHRV